MIDGKRMYIFLLDISRSGISGLGISVYSALVPTAKKFSKVVVTH